MSTQQDIAPGPAIVLVLLGAMATIFITLKLFGLIEWSWWLVLMPIWIMPASILAALFIVFVASVTMHLMEFFFE